jgi:F0F1-type ATP synthase gamma subunit
MLINQIKLKIKKNDNILKITNSLKIINMTRIKQLYMQKELLYVHLENIYKNFIIPIKKNTENIYKIHILLFTDMSFCGQINKKNLNFMRNYQNNNDICYIIGSKGIQKNLYKEYFLGKLYEKNIIDTLYDKIMEMHEKYNYQICIHDHINKHQIIVENYIDNFYMQCYLKYWLYSHIINFKYEECKIRLTKITTAINNSEILKNTLNILYNKTRQGIITRDLLEIIASSETKGEK